MRGRALPPVVCFSNLDWDYLRYRKQHLMERIGRTTPVVYVNPPRACKWKTPRQWGVVTTVAKGVRVYEPPVLPGIRRSRAMKALTYRRMAADLRRLLPEDVPPLMWIYSPHAAAFIDLLPPQALVYDMADDYTVPTGGALRGPDEARELASLAALEQKLLRRADLVFAVSQPLVDKAKAAGARQVQLLPNGCDVDRYADRPAAPRRSRQPVIGYVGTIAPRVDVELVCALARLRSDWRFEMVGPVTPHVTLPADMPANLTWTGEIPYADVPAAITRFDAGILPLREIDYAYKSSPIQVFDYLAAGKPVVSSPVAQFERWPSMVTTARGAEGFAAALDQALGIDSVELQALRRRFAAGESWDARAEAAMTAIRAAA